MRILVIGGGGREHALVKKLSESALAEKIFCIPGNAGIEKIAECADIDIMDNNKLASFARENSIGLTVVGPEAPLVNGIVDEFEKQGLLIFGPRKQAALLEGSKAFAKEIMLKNNIPTGRAAAFEDISSAESFIKRNPWARVIKADGLASGKGVYVCSSEEEALSAARDILVDRRFGNAGNVILVEEKLQGEEASFLAFSDGATVKPMPASQDHKPVFDDDRGPNTGGMGAYAPAPIVTPEISQIVMDRIMIPAVQAMSSSGCPYRGVLYAGLMMTCEGPRVLEFNCRFGDPETQPLMMLLKSDLAEIMLACAKGTLSDVQVDFANGAACCVVMASQGYPGSYTKGKQIIGLDEASASDTTVFHAATRRIGDRIYTDGGRVLGVTGRGESVGEAIDNAYSVVSKISFEGCSYRKDIGRKALVVNASAGHEKKAELRKEYLAKRDSMASEEAAEKSRAICQRLTGLPEYKAAKTVLMYASFRNEVDTAHLIRLAHGSKRIILPRIKGSGLELCEIRDMDSLKENRFGIPEPGDCQRLCSADEIDLAIIPGVVFDRNGYRIGFGKGYYDRLLKEMKARKIGLAYDMQVINNFQQDVHDIPVDALVTENEVMHFRNLIDGKASAEKIISGLAEEVKSLPGRPALSVILVGDDPASQTYVKIKQRKCEQAGIESTVHIFDRDVPEKEVTGLIERLNRDSGTNGILVQLPLPGHLNEREIINTIRPDKDVDCLTWPNAGKVFSGSDSMQPCTPFGIMRLLEDHNIDPSGMHAVVIGRSNIVGRPAAALFLRKNATVTVCHSCTRNLSEIARQADILVTAAGKPGLVTGDMVKDGAIVIDVGTSRVNGKLAGDTDFESIRSKCRLITPVPGGVGPMTVAMLLHNTVRCYENQTGHTHE